jgi:hypothetical protein
MALYESSSLKTLCIPASLQVIDASALAKTGISVGERNCYFCYQAIFCSASKELQLSDILGVAPIVHFAEILKFWATRVSLSAGHCHHWHSNLDRHCLELGLPLFGIVHD